MIPSNIDYVAKHIFIWNIYSNKVIIPYSLYTGDRSGVERMFVNVY